MNFSKLARSLAKLILPGFAVAAIRRSIEESRKKEEELKRRKIEEEERRQAEEEERIRKEYRLNFANQYYSKKLELIRDWVPPRVRIVVAPI